MDMHLSEQCGTSKEKSEERTQKSRMKQSEGPTELNL